MATKITIGHASISESGSANGQGGDQTGKEVYIQENFSITGSFKPDVVLRPTRVSLARDSAIACILACKNDAIGYSQTGYGGRNSLEKRAAEVGYDVSKITEPCNTDCSAFMTLCAVIGGAKFSYYNSWNNAPVCSTMQAWFTQNGDYIALTDSVYLTITDHLRIGDILVDKDRHTVMVLENGVQVLDPDVMLPDIYIPSSSGTPSSPSTPSTPGSSNTTDSSIAGSVTKITLHLTNIESTDISVMAEIIKVEQNKESLYTDIDRLNKYKWEACVEALDDSVDRITPKKLELDSNTFRFSLSGLTPGKTYILNVVSKDDTGNIKIRSANIIFTTLQSYPSEIRNFVVSFDKDSNNKCNLTFTEPRSWGAEEYKHGYRVILIVNGQVVGYNDDIIIANKNKINNILVFKDINKKVIFNNNDIVQIGIQPWLQDSEDNIIFNSASLVCSQPLYIMPSLKIIDKMFINVKGKFNKAFINRSR